MIRLTRLFLLVVSILSLNTDAYAQLTAGFNIVTPTSNCNPAIYSFVNTSTGSGLTYQWNFGIYPGVNSIFANPSTTYLNCGTFHVKLIVTDANGRKDSSLQTVTVRCSPIPTFNTAATTGCLPLAATFTSTSNPGSGNITDYLWDFGDGSNGTAINPNHTYTSPGCKNVTLIITNSYNCKSDTTIHNLLCAYPTPINDFTSSNPSSCSPPFSVTYQAKQGSGTAPYTYQWLFQGGVPSSSSSAVPLVVYNTTGSYNTTLITTDAHGCTDTTTKSNYITVGSDTVGFNTSISTICSPSTIAFSGTASGTPTTWSWTTTAPGTVSSATNRNTNLIFPSAGSYNVCLNAIYAGGCTARKCTTITVNPKPVANFGINGSLNTCVIPNSITFLDSSVGNNLRYNWSFAGGLPATSNLAIPSSIVYNNCGSYSASLTVTDNVGCSSATTKTNFLRINCNRASYTVTPSNGCLPLTAYFHGSATGTPISWLWDFDDPNSGLNNISTLQNPSHTFLGAGCYTVKLTTTDILGCVSTYSIPAGVCAGWKPHANFSANPPQNCANQPIYFNDQSTGIYSYTGYTWNFHGDTVPIIVESVDQDPNYTYYDAGTYSITLIVSNYGCADTITLDDLVTTFDPVASPKVVKNCGNPLSVTLDGSQSHGADHYHWIILGGTPDTANTPSVTATFPRIGDYNASLLVTNDSTGCSDLQNVIVHITDVGAQFSATPTKGCQPLKSCFSNTSTMATSYQWRVYSSNGVLDTTATIASPCFNFTNAGLYSVQLIVTDTFGCTDTVYKPDYIKVSHPLSGFSASPINGCAPMAVDFHDASIANFASLAKWKWQFGDTSSHSLDSSALQNPAHTYINSGSYTVRLTVIDTNGCKSDSTILHYINVHKPMAKFSQVDSITCREKLSCFTLKDTDAAATYRWEFGDGTAAMLANVCHSFVASGNFQVSLAVTDTFGCNSTASIIDSVKLFTPQVAFTADTTTTACPPLLVTFTNLSSASGSSVTWQWNFGDGQISFLQNPTHIYSSAGKYTVSLIATHTSGCSDTVSLVDYIAITGPTAFVSTAPTSGCVPNATCMSANSAFANTFTWNLGDGMVQAGTDSICYTYTRSGIFYPELILSNGNGCIFSLPMGRVDVGGSVARFTPDRLELCQQGDVAFQDSSFGTSPPATWTWDFGDQTSGTQNHSALKNPIHHFSSPGIYAVTERIVSVDGCVDSTSLIINVHATLSPSIVLSDSAICGAADITFNALGNSSGQTTNAWDFGDSLSGAFNFSSLQNPSHHYNVGDYHVHYTASDGNGCTSIVDTTVIVHPRPIASFLVRDTCLDTQPIAFANTSQMATHFLWDLGDGYTSRQIAPTHTYIDSGRYLIQLVALTDYCADTTRMPVNIFTLPSADFDIPVASYCGSPADFLLANNSLGASDYVWDFGNGGSSILDSPTATYDSIGTYSILLTAINAHGCRDTISKPVTIHARPLASFVIHDTCLNTQPLVITNNSQGATTYLWQFADGNTSSMPNPSQVYAHSGNYTVQLTVQNAFCSDTATFPVHIFPLPNAGFDVSANSRCGTPAAFEITNTSSNAIEYHWDFGNSAFSTQATPAIVFDTIGTHTIMLSAINQYQCADTISKQVEVFPNPKISGVGIGPVEGCQPLAVTLNAIATDGNYFIWDFGTKTNALGAIQPINPVTSTSAAASYLYTDTGKYTISLYVRSIHECVDSIVLTDTVTVHPLPVAAFDTFTNSSAYPYDGTVGFINRSIGAQHYIWEFGDGNTSTETSPQHPYDRIDGFDVTLVSVTNYGCADTAYKTIHAIKKSLWAPNALEPDNQGGNELMKVWKPLGIGLAYYHAQVFNQWGQLLWESEALEDTQPTESWDGTYEGKSCLSDVYVWKIDAVFLDGTIWPGMTYGKDEGGGTKNIGSITLVR